MSEIKRYDAPTGIMDSCDEGDWVLYSDHQAALAAAQREIEGLKALHRMQMAAISVAALMNTRASAEGWKMHKDEPYWTPAYQDVCIAIEREMKERDRADKAEAERDEAVRTLKRAKLIIESEDTHYIGQSTREAAVEALSMINEAIANSNS